jgi:hypothetical protein
MFCGGFEVECGATYAYGIKSEDRGERVDPALLRLPEGK